LYSFNHKPSFSGDCLNVSHTFELEFVWPGFINIPLTSQEKSLSKKMVSYWTGFAKSIDSQIRKFNWPQYQSDTKVNLIFDLKISQESNYRQKQCNFWDNLNPFK